MSLAENIRMAVFNIRTNLMRSILTMLGIIIGVSSVIAIITVGDGGRDYIISMIRDMSSNSVNVNVNAGVPETDYITDDDIKYIKKIEGVKFASPSGYSLGTATSLDTSAMAIAMAGNEDYQYIMNMTMNHGRFFTREEYENGENVCVLSVIGAMTLFNREDVVGESFDLTLNGQTVRMRIIGVSVLSTMTDVDMSDSMDMMSSMGNGASMEMAGMVIPATVLNSMTNMSGYATLSIMAENEFMLDTAGNAAKNILCSRHGNFDDDAYIVVNMATYIDLLDKVINILTTFIAGVSAISLIVGGIGVMNIMLVSVTERTREIGIRKALGAKTKTIMAQFLTESVILCLIGGIIGFVIGVGGAAGISAWMDIPVKLKFSTVAIAVGFSSAIGIFFGIYPARKAAKMLPIDALRRD